MKAGLYILFFLVFLSFHVNAQQVQSDMKAVTIRVKPRQDLKIVLEEFVQQEQIKAGCILSCAGSLTQYSIRFADHKEATTGKGHFEIVSLSGTLSVNGSHLHISVSDEKGSTVGGHLKEGSLIYTTAEIVIGVLSDVQYIRETDDTYGYKELKILPSSK